MFRGTFPRTEDTACGSDLMLAFFTSGTTGYPKIAMHNHKYPLGHFVTAYYWQCVDPDGLHLTISDTGWAKSMWGKLYGQWLCEAAVFVYDFDRFDSSDICRCLKNTASHVLRTCYDVSLHDPRGSVKIRSVQHQARRDGRGSLKSRGVQPV
jgi:acyl-coenzyme A synthetase/AMP-(fatty) acid ligase